MQGLAGQVSSLRKQISGVDELNKDVQALVTLQRERYYELLQSQAQKVSAAETSEKVLIQCPNPEHVTNARDATSVSPVSFLRLVKRPLHWGNAS